MFTQSALNEEITRLLELPADERWQRRYAFPDIEYNQRHGEEKIRIYSGSLKVWETNSDVPVDPISFFLHSAMLISFAWRGIKWDRWDSQEEQDIVLNDWLNRALCRPMSVTEFHERYHSVTRWRLPRALIDYEPITQALCMEEVIYNKIYMAKNDRSYITFHWGTSA